MAQCFGHEALIVYRVRNDRFFDHEALDVYQAALQLVAWLESMLDCFSCSADLKVKLDKSTTSLVLNIAEGNGRLTDADQMKFYETAYKATIQSSSLVDIATANTANGTTDVSRLEQGRELLRRIAAMLTALSKVVAND